MEKLNKSAFKSILLLIAICLFKTTLYAQTQLQMYPTDPPPYVEMGINTPVSPAEYVYKGRDGVTLLPNTLIQANSKVYLDPSIQAVVNYNNTPDGLGFSDPLPELDKDLDLGTIPGQASVNLMGGASYSILFDFPKGSGGVVPQISLTYNSSGGMGIAGLGWNLNGLHAITRGGRNYLNDVRSTSVMLTNDDWFEFDGQKLISEGQNGVANMHYHTQEENFSRIISKVNGSGQIWWEILTKDGILIEIGNSQNSVILNSGTPVQWMVNKIKDSNGNYITYEYEIKEDSEIYLKKLIYAKNDLANILDDCEINFYYNLGHFPSTYKIGEKKLKSTVILREISSKINGVIYSKYNFNYNKKHIWEFLVSIQKSNRFGKKMNPTYFTYEDNFATSPLDNIYFKDNNLNVLDVFPTLFDKNVFFVDFNGDGKKDMIFDQGLVFGASLRKLIVFKNNGVDQNGKVIFEKVQEITDAIPPDVAQLQLNTSESRGKNSNISQDIQFKDINGDGYEDFMLTSQLFKPLNERNIQIKLYLSNGNNTDPYYVQPLITGGGINLSNADIPFSILSNTISVSSLLGDFDGDSKCDVIVMIGNVDFCQIHLFNQDNAYNSSGAILVSSDNINFLNAYVERNGTSTNEIIRGISLNGSGAFINVINGIPHIFNSTDPTFNTNCISFDPQSGTVPTVFFLNGDFNGDGYNDLLRYFPTNPNGANYLGTWQLNGEQIDLDLANVLEPDCKNFQFAYDVNGDGKTDIIQLIPNGTNEKTVNVYFSTGYKFILGETFTIGTTIESVTFSDVNGDGVLDMILPSTLADSKIGVHYFKKGLTTCLLNKVKDGLGKITQLSYDLAQKLSSNYEVHYFPTLVIGISGRILKSIESDNGIGQFIKTEYFHENPVFDMQGNGFLGYLKSTTRNITDQITIVKYNKFFDLDGMGFMFTTLVPCSTEVWHSNGIQNSILLKKDEFFYVYSQIETFNNSYLFPRSTYLIKPTKTINSNGQTGAVITEDITIDNENNNTYSKTNYNGIETVETTTVYDQNNKFTYAFLPETVTQIKTKGTNSHSNTTNFSYWPNINKLKSVTKLDPVSNLTNYQIVKNYTYYPNGSLEKEITTTSDYNLEEVFYYDAKNKNLIKKKNSLGQFSYFTYDPIGNMLISSKEVNGLLNTIEYDGWFRAIKNIAPSGVISEVKYEWASSNEIAGSHPVDLSNILYKITTSKEGSPQVIQYFDRLNRPILTASEGISEWFYSVNEYNAKGQLVKKYEPYSINNASILKRYEQTDYDDLGRVHKISIFDNAIQTFKQLDYTFGTGTSTVTESSGNGATKATTTDATGNVTQITDALNGNVYYNYYLDPNNKSRIETKVNSFVVTKSIFDEGGNQISLWDKQAGETTYEYNGSGQLKKQTDPNGSAYTFEYYNDSRLHNKIGSEGTYTYYYEGSNNGKNMLKELQGPNGFIKYSYDNLQRLTKLEENYLSESYISEMQYDNFGNEIKYIYPSNFAIKKQYDSKGNLIQISRDDNNENIWHLDEVNGMGKIWKYTKGDNDQTQLTYGNDRRISLIDNPNSTGKWSYTYYPHTGSIHTRTRIGPVLSSKTEEFNYDLQDRLRTSEVIAGGSFPILETTYDMYGKIQKKTDVGNDYVYNPSFRLTSIEDPTVNMPKNEQLVSYNGFKLPSTIKEYIGNIPANNDPQAYYQLDYTYGPNQQRIKGVWTLSDPTNGNTQYRTRKYLMNYEINEETKNNISLTHKVHYINSPTGMCAMYVIEEQNGAPLPESHLGGGMKYIHTDLLGSYTSITTQDGVVFARQDFDAWGRRRNPLTYTYSPQNTVDIDRGVPTFITSLLPNWLYRGYTGHEMLNEFGLINMNARLYDPLVGMMLSPDNFVQDASNSQNYNRYAYCLNNPLKYTDPSGNNWEDRMQNGFGYVTNPLRKFGDSFDRFQNNITGQTSTSSTAASGGLSVGSSAFSPAAQSASGAPGGFTDASGEFVSNNELVADAHKLYLLNHGGYNADANGNLYRTTTYIKKVFEYQLVSGGYQGAWIGHTEIADRTEMYNSEGTIYDYAQGGRGFAPTLKGTYKEGLDGFAIAIGVVNAAVHMSDQPKSAGVKVAKFINSTSTAAKITGVIGHTLGLVAVGNDITNIYNKGFSNATFADYAKLSISIGMLGLKANPLNFGISIGYGLLDAAGYNPVDIIYKKVTRP